MSQTNIIESRPRRRTRISRSRAQWRTLVAKHHDTELTHKEFCRQHQITSSSLYKWRKVFAESSDPSPFIEITDKLASAEITPSSVAHASNDWQVELALGQGLVLRINLGKG